MPDSSEPRLAAWLARLGAEVAHPDERTFFVAHSLGAVTLLKYLDRFRRTPASVARSSWPASSMSFLHCRS
jgi:predicted alpha/beta hydrolase family esterase